MKSKRTHREELEDVAFGDAVRSEEVIHRVDARLAREIHRVRVRAHPV